MTIGLYTIAYSDAVLGQVEPGFQVFDCRNDPAPEKREIYHIQRFYRSGEHRKYAYSGLFSPKFAEKARMSGPEFAQFVEANPGYDAYFINPYPFLAYLSFNVWEQGELVSPGLCALANVVFEAGGTGIDVYKLPRNKPDTLSYCNFWVGNERFWDEFMRFVEPLIAVVDDLPEPMRQKVFSLAPYLTPATYYPFIFERMFSTFLLLRPDIKAKHYPCPPAEMHRFGVTPMEGLVIHELGPLIERWDTQDAYTPEQRRIIASLLKITYTYNALHFR